VIRAVAVAAALAMGATTAAAAPSPWQRATTSADAAQAARAYDEAMLEGDDRVAQAANTVVYEQRKRLVRAALDAYDRAALARPDLAEPRWRAATVVNAFLLECEQDRAPLCGREPRASDAERAIAYWDAAERLAPLDPRFTDRVHVRDRAILHTKLATPTHLRGRGASTTRRMLDRMPRRHRQRRSVDLEPRRAVAHHGQHGRDDDDAR
jgi:hypothetical protein